MREKTFAELPDKIDKIQGIIGGLLFLFLIIFFLWLFIEPIITTKPIHNAAKQGDLSGVKKMLTQGIPIDLPGPHGNTPLYLALEEKQIEVAKYLLDKGASVKDTLSVAIGTGDIEIIKTVINRGEKVNPGCLVATIYHREITGEENLEVSDYLLEAGADINAKASFGRGKLDEGEFNGYTALHCAVRRRDGKLVDYLVNKGADVNAVTADGTTPLEIAETDYRVWLGDATGPGIHYYEVNYRSPAIAKFLRSKGAQYQKK